MNAHFTYFLILGASIIGPFALSFDKKVMFYKKWKYLFPAMVLPALFYVIWDIYFTSKGVWSFNENYITGLKLINLPIEEVLFFIIVPYCCIFIYECIRCYFPSLQDNRWSKQILKGIGILLLVSGIYFNSKYYTSWTFIFTAIFIAFIYIAKSFFKDFHSAYFLVSYAIILIPFLLVNGLLTSIPVVLYNDIENLGVRIYTIPMEDVFYGMLLVMMDISIYEKLRNRL
jgi:lycopene cyclase domain-containing protein